MRRDKRELIAAGKEPEEQQDIVRIAGGPAQYLPQRFFGGCAGHVGRRRGLKIRQHEQGREDHDCHDDHGRIPPERPLQILGNRRDQNLSRRSCRRSNPQRHRTLLRRGRAPNNREHHTKTRPRHPEADQNSAAHHLTKWCAGICGDDQTNCIDTSPENNRFAVAVLLGEHPEQRLSDSPGKVLNRNRHRKVAARPVELFSNWHLKHAKRRANPKTNHQDDRGRDQNWGQVVLGANVSHSGLLTANLNARATEARSNFVISAHTSRNPHLQNRNNGQRRRHPAKPIQAPLGDNRAPNRGPDGRANIDGCRVER